MAAGAPPGDAFRNAIANIAEQMVLRAYLLAAGVMDDTFEEDIAQRVCLQLRALDKTMAIVGGGQGVADFVADVGASIVEATARSIVDLRLTMLPSGCVQ